jgi:hypothetical protein
MKVVQNKQPTLEDIQPVIDEKIVDTVHDIFESIMKLNPLYDLFEDLANRLTTDLKANSLLEFNLELTEDQKKQLLSVVRSKGQETARNYQANLNSDKRTKLVYGLVRERTTEIADAVLSSIGQEINRGAVINARAVQANSKNDKYDEILLRKTKSSGDITVPTNVIVVSTNCVDVIKASCQTAKGDKGPEGDAANKPAKPKGKKANKK